LFRAARNSTIGGDRSKRHLWGGRAIAIPKLKSRCAAAQGQEPFPGFKEETACRMLKAHGADEKAREAEEGKAAQDPLHLRHHTGDGVRAAESAGPPSAAQPLRIA
jgi:hypothetical protein